MEKQVHVKTGFMGKWERYIAEVDEKDGVLKINLKAYLGDLKNK